MPPPPQQPPPPAHFNQQYQPNQSQQQPDHSSSSFVNSTDYATASSGQQPANSFYQPASDFNSNNLANDGFNQLPDDSAYAFKTPDSFLSGLSRSIGGRYQSLLDAVTPHWAARWTFSLVVLMIFMARIVIAQGWYVICYGLSIYYLNLFIGFLSPKIDPAFQASLDEDDFGGGSSDLDSGPMLPTKANDEFRPFIRRLPEFKFWLSATKATLISLLLTLFEVFDLPVFWPILLLYFLLLFISTMRQQIRHMIKYGYVPWDKGKKKYGKQINEEPSSLFSATI